MNTAAKISDYSKEELRASCQHLLGNIASELGLFAATIFQRGGEVHLIGQVHTGEFVHFRTWILHMRDCRKELAEGKVFIGGYIRTTFEESERKSNEDGNDCIDYGKVFFHYGWFENNPKILAELIKNAQPEYFPNFERIRTESQRKVDALL